VSCLFRPQPLSLCSKSVRRCVGAAMAADGHHSSRSVSRCSSRPFRAFLSRAQRPSRGSCPMPASRNLPLRATCTTRRQRASGHAEGMLGVKRNLTANIITCRLMLIVWVSVHTCSALTKPRAGRPPSGSRVRPAPGRSPCTAHSRTTPSPAPDACAPPRQLHAHQRAHTTHA
jgi:hypothetical protein